MGQLVSGYQGSWQGWQLLTPKLSSLEDGKEDDADAAGPEDNAITLCISHY